MSLSRLRRFAASADCVLVDHGMEVHEADVTVVHNLMTEAVRHVQLLDWLELAAQEGAFFRALRPGTPIVANSQLVKRALIEHFGLDAERIVVQYPGFDSKRFRPRDERVGGSYRGDTGDRDARGEDPVRATTEVSDTTDRDTGGHEARRQLGIGQEVPLVGLITSGDLQKRGLDIFLAAAELIVEARPDVRFLVIGSKRLPEWAASHSLISGGHVLYRPKNRNPQIWMAALDIFLYPARFEEFGMVVAESQAVGLPVLTSRRVGAAECLPQEYGPWLVDEPDAGAFAAKALALLADGETRRVLAAAGVASVAAYDNERYTRASVDLIRRCATEKRKQ
jgi:glycosyltransferase involved in cell wall biosynthesis